MLNFYRTLQELNPNAQNLALTVLDGPDFGAKALISAGRLAWPTAPDGFFARNADAALALQDSGLYEIDGQQVFCEVLGQQKKLVICGAGHISIPIIRMGLMIGCTVTVIEDRPLFAGNAREAGATEVFCEPFDQALGHIEGDADTFFVIVTRGHRHDQTCLEQILRKPHAYIGMIGSRKRVATVKQTLLQNGADPEVLAQVYTPIGLKIGAETPEEIAISILAEIIEVKNKVKRQGGYPPELLRALLGDEAHKALLTIVTRRGSAPRGVGTRMLLFADGRTIGTIGGGCAEAEVLGKARRKLVLGKHQPELYCVDMTGRDAEEEGMVCGGVIQVLIEIV